MIHMLTELADGGFDALPEPLRDVIGEYGENGTLSIVSGAVSIARGVQTLPTNRKRGLLKLLVGAGWIAIGLVQRRRSLGSGGEEREESLESDEPIGEGGDVDDVTPGETDDEIAASNTLPPSDVGEPEGHDTGEADPVETAAEPAEMTGPTAGDAAPETDKTTVPNEPPADDISMASEGDAGGEGETGGDERANDDESTPEDDDDPEDDEE